MKDVVETSDHLPAAPKSIVTWGSSPSLRLIHPAFPTEKMAVSVLGVYLSSKIVSPSPL